MAIKIFKLGKRFNPNEERYALNDFVKAICDLCACADHYDVKTLDNYFVRVCRLNEYHVKDVFNAAKRRIKDLPTDSEARDWYERSGQTSYLAKSRPLIELTNGVSEVLAKISI